MPRHTVLIQTCTTRRKVASICFPSFPLELILLSSHAAWLDLSRLPAPRLRGADGVRSHAAERRRIEDVPGGQLGASGDPRLRSPAQVRGWPRDR